MESINGHSSAVVENYYLKLNRAEDVHQARALFQVDPSSPQRDRTAVTTSSPASTPTQSTFTTQTTFRPSDDLSHLKWGADHPDKNPTPTKVTWSDSELEYIKEWQLNNVLDGRNPIARCLNFIRDDSDARKIFHHHHVLNSARLRVGYNSSLKKYMQLTDV